MIAASTAELSQQRNRARHRAAMARFVLYGRRGFQIGPFVGPLWPDSVQQGAA
jgi:hypothetical protein